MHDTGILYDEQPLIENIDVWISSLSSSTLRPFRHTATLVALTIMTALCRVANREIELAAQVQRQLESEKKKKGANKARLADFQQKVKKNEDNKAFIESRLTGFFDTVYTHRYRDVDPKIRIECAASQPLYGHQKTKSLLLQPLTQTYQGVVAVNHLLQDS